MAPLFPLWGAAYHSQFPQVTLRSASSSSGVGISSAAAGTTDIGASDAYLSPADMTKDPALVNIPLAVAALMVIYNIPGVSPSTHLKLNGGVLARIFSGRITAWNDPAIASVNPGVKLPGTKIVLVHRADSSGSTFLFTSYLNAQDSIDWSSSLIGTTVAWPGQPGEIGASGSGAVVTSVASAPGSVGYIGVSYLSKVTAAGEGEAELGNPSGNYVLPTPRTIQAALASFTNTPANEVFSLINSSGAAGLPDHQLRVRHREHLAIQRHEGAGPAGIPRLGDLERNLRAGAGELSAAAVIGHQPVPGADRRDQGLTRDRGRHGT